MDTLNPRFYSLQAAWDQSLGHIDARAGETPISRRLGDVAASSSSRGLALGAEGFVAGMAGALPSDPSDIEDALGLLQSLAEGVLACSTHEVRVHGEHGEPEEAPPPHVHI